MSGNASLSNKTNTLKSSKELENFLWNTTKFLPWTISLVLHFFFFPFHGESVCSFFTQRWPTAWMIFELLNTITSFFKEFFNAFLNLVVDKNEWMKMLNFFMNWHPWNSAKMIDVYQSKKPWKLFSHKYKERNWSLYSLKLLCTTFSPLYEYFQSLSRRKSLETLRELFRLPLMSFVSVFIKASNCCSAAKKS